VYMLSRTHAGALQRLAAEPEVAAAIGLADASEAAVVEFIETQAQARADGAAHTLVLVDRGELLGVCGLLGIGEKTSAHLMVAIARAHRGKGNAAFAAARVLELAFQNLQLDLVAARASAGDLPCERLLARLGFRPRAGEPGRHADYELARRGWQESRARPALAALHPSLQPILRAELAAGNELAEMSTGWPDADSVFVRLRHAFRTRPAPLPAGVEYHEPNDPHWWKADYSSTSPRHVLAS